MRNLIGLIVFLFTVPLAAYAQENGIVSLEVEGETIQMALWEDRSDWNDTSGSAQTNFSSNITTFASSDENPDGPERLQLELEYSGDHIVYVQIRIGYRQDDETLLWLIGDGDTSTTVALDQFMIEGDLLAVSGHFAGHLGTRDDDGTTIDPSDGLEVKGTFDVTLSLEE